MPNFKKHYYPDKYRMNNRKQVYCGRKLSFGLSGMNGAIFATNKTDEVTCDKCLSLMKKYNKI